MDKSMLEQGLWSMEKLRLEQRQGEEFIAMLNRVLVQKDKEWRL